MTCLRIQAERVAALQELWERADPSPERRLFRHAFYARLASRKPDVWALCGTAEQRATAVKDPSSLPRGSHPVKGIVAAWNAALKEAFDGLEFQNIRGKQSGGKPLGVWTTELKSKD